jgi:hypothetical protein
MVLIKKGNRYHLKFAIYAYKTINIADIIMQKAILKLVFNYLPDITDTWQKF